VHSYYVSTLQALLEELGSRESDLLRDTGVAAATRMADDFSLNARQMDALCSNALAVSQDPQLGLRLGSRINMSSQGIFGYALMTSATVGDALKLLIRYSRIILPSIRIEVQQRGDWVDVVVEAAQLTLALERFYCEVLFAAIIHNGSLLIGDSAVVVSLELDYPPPDDSELYHLIFGPEVHFGGDRCVLSFDAASLGIAISTANPVAQHIFRRECDRLSALDQRRGSVSERVQQVLLESGSVFPTSAAVAQRLHMSESTLRRRLANEGCRYQQLLDQVRFRLAREYLLGTMLPVADIGQLLGFSDTTNFRRSFRRWSGAQPSQFRSERGLKGRNV
jgi:AraC-like DNA-binding protein